MATPKGNEFWKLRSKHGRNPKLTFEQIEEIHKVYKESRSEGSPLLLKEFYKELGISSAYVTNQRDKNIINLLKSIKSSFEDNNISLYIEGKIPIEIVARSLKGKQVNVEVNSDYYSINKKKKRRRENGYFKTETEGYVYFLKSDCSKYYKVGFSTNPKRRLRDINASVPFEIYVLAVKKDLFAINLELNIHQKYKDFVLKGECYNLNLSQEKDIIKILTKDKQ